MSSPTPHPRRWSIAFLLGAGVLVNYFDRVNLSVSHAALLATFGISNLTFGLLSGAYNWTYALCQLPVGVLLDRIGVQRTGRVSTFIWALASFSAALAPGIPTLFGARLLLGIGEAPTFPANSKAIGLWFPPAERSTATATFDAAAKLASALGVPLLGLLLLRIGWRWSFAATGLLSLLYCLAFTLLYRDPPPLVDLNKDSRHLDPRAAERSDPSTRLVPPTPSAIAPPIPHQQDLSLPTLLRNRQVLGLALGMGAYNYVFYLLVTWLPSYISFALGVDLLHSFLYTGVPWLAATAAELATAFLADALMRRHPAAAPRIRRIILLAGTTFGLGILGAAHARTPAHALLWISVSIAGLASTCPVAWSVPTLLVPPSRVGTVGGIVNFSNQLSGIAAPILTGLVVQRTHSYTAAFLIAGAYLALGLLAYAFLLRPLGPIAPASSFPA